MSIFTIGHQALRKLRLNPSGPGLLLPSQLQIVSLISSSRKGSSKAVLSSSDKELNTRPSRKGRLFHSSVK
jgi:hypothetical protein